MDILAFWRVEGVVRIDGCVILCSGQCLDWGLWDEVEM